MKFFTAILVLLAFLSSDSAIAAELDRYGGHAALKGKVTGWFHVEQIGGRWFFVTPEGHAFFDHVLALAGKPSLLADVNTMTMRPEKDFADATRHETRAASTPWPTISTPPAAPPASACTAAPCATTSPGIRSSTAAACSKPSTLPARSSEASCAVRTRR